MSKEERPIKVGDRFASKDGRDRGRVVEVREVLGLTESAEKHLAGIDPSNPGAVEHAARVTQRKTFYRVETEAHPKNPDAVGNVSRVSERTLRTRYRRVSR